MQRFPFAALLALALSAATVRADTPADPWGDPSPGLARLGELAGATAVAVASDGEAAAVAVPNSSRARSSVVRVTTGPAQPAVTEAEVDGTVRAMSFGTGNDSIHLVVHRPARRKGPGRTYHLRFAIPSMSATRPLSLPVTARAIEVRPTERALLVACDDEIRSFRLDGLLSGPLFRVPGVNRSLATIPGTTRVLVGQDERVVEVDLDAPQGREGLEPLRVFPVPSAVAAIREARDGRGMEALLEDGTIVPLATAEPPAPSPRPVETAAAPEPEPEPAPPVREPRPAQAPVPAPEPEARPVPGPELAAGVVAGTGAASARGTVRGDSGGVAVEVVLYGPDNVQRAAARVPVGASGRWRVTGLAAGRYRVVLEAGGDRVLVTRPGFVTVDAGERDDGLAPEIEIVRVISP